MAIEASQVYWRHPELYDAEATAARRRSGRLPALPNLQLCRTATESMAINALRGGAIVIAGSGMCTGGRIVHHLKLNLPRPECTVIFSGFQAVGTLGRARTWLVHGEASGSAGLREALVRRGIDAHIARPLQSLDLATLA
jgi:metallo-beta-lactamase family protein